MNTTTLDSRIINFFRKISIPLARLALGLIYIWFGYLKVIGQSPASPMVHELLNRSMSFIPFNTFIILFGLFEILIGLLFLIPKMERVALLLFFVHMVTTILPLFLMTGFVWTHFLTPTLEGQYIIKNIALIACAVFIGAQLRPKTSLGA